MSRRTMKCLNVNAALACLMALLWPPLPAGAQAVPGAKTPSVQQSGKPAPPSTVSGTAAEQTRSFEEWVAEMMKPRPYPKDVIVRVDEHFARPHTATPWKFRIVKEEGDTVWLQPLPPEDPGSPLHAFWLQEQERQALIKHQLENPEQVNMLNFDEPVPPLPFQDGFRFDVVQDGLPRR